MIRNGYVTRRLRLSLSNELTKKDRPFVFPPKKKDEAPAWLTSSVSWEKLQNTSVGGRKNFPLVVLDDTLGDNLIKWPLNLLWVKGDLNFLAWNTQQEVYERARLGVPIVKPVPKNS